MKNIRAARMKERNEIKIAENKAKLLTTNQLNGSMTREQRQNLERKI